MDDEELWRAYAWPQRSLRVNFVTSIDGHIQGTDGLSGPLSGPEDRRLFHMLRAGCDAVLVGAGTARTETYRPIRIKPEWERFRSRDTPPDLVIVSASGNVPDIEGARVVDGTDMPGLREEYPRILCEGGPALFAALLAAGLVDEFAWSIAGRVGGSGQLLTGNPRAHATPKHTHFTAEGVFTLWDIT